MAKNSNCQTINQTKRKIPRLPFLYIKNKILGPKYNLEIVFLLSKDQLKLNKIYRGRDQTTNVLSFPYDKNSGLITFDLAKIKKETPLFGLSYPLLLKFLLIHGCLHLKGFKHSSRMEKEEEKFMKKLS